MKHSEDKKGHVRQLFPLVKEIKNSVLRNKVLDVWLRALNETKYEELEVSSTI